MRAPGFLHICFFLRWNSSSLHPQVFRGSLFFTLLKMFAFSKGVIVGLGSLPFTLLEPFASFYWGQRTEPAGEED